VRVRRTTIPALACCLALAGCGDDGGGESKQPTGAPPGAPRAKQPLAAAARRLQAALPRADCRELMALMMHSIQRGVTDPATPPKPSECGFVRREADADLRGYRVTKVRDLGVAGFTEGTGTRPRSGNVVGVVWALDSDGSWKAIVNAVFRPQIGPAPERTAAADQNARGFVTALRRADCPLAWRGLNVASRFVRANRGERRAFCRATRKLYRDPASAFSQIKADPGATPRLLGRTRDFSFYSLELRNGRQTVLVMAGQIGGIADAELREHVNPSVLEFLTVRQPKAG
jgi:hypothetical protein